MLTDKDLMPYGVHKGKEMANILETDKMLLYIEWNHYTNGTIDTDTFGEFINQHLQKYML